MMYLAQAAEVFGGRLHGTDRLFCGVSTDSRTLKEGELFVALHGERFDGHDFVADCASRVAGAVVARPLDAPCAQIVVPDPLAALQTLAHEWRRQQQKVAVAAITGSNGKTSTHEMLATIFAAHGETLASPGNWNNHIGVPLTLLRLTPQHRYAVIEMGANHPGEISQLTAMAEPQAAAITCVAEAHLEGFGSLEGVASAKAEIFEGLRGQGVAIINAEDRFAPQWHRTVEASRILTFAMAPTEADVVAAAEAPSTLTLCYAGQSERIEWPLEGTHNVRNAACAVALACALEVPFQSAAQALSGFQLKAGGRLQFLQGCSEAQIIDDSYNANPGSFRAAIDVLVALPQEPWLVMGEMQELGPDAEEHHLEVARYARAAGVQRLYALGTYARQCAEAFGSKGQACSTQQEIADALRTDMGAHCAILVKGSRAAQLEQLVAQLVPGGQAHAA